MSKNSEDTTLFVKLVELWFNQVVVPELQGLGKTGDMIQQSVASDRISDLRLCFVGQ
jgi:hypothetical protein